MDKEKKLDFLLGAVSPMGFAGYFSTVVKQGEWRSVLIKAGPGCGKSTLMKKVADAFAEQGKTVELIHCSSDPDSLDGVICSEAKFCILDATAPHTLEPQYPVAVEEVLPLFQYMRSEILRPHQSEVVGYFNQCKILQERAVRYITAAGSLIMDSMRTAAMSVNIPKAEKYAKTLVQKMPNLNKCGQEEIRLLSAITLRGPLFYKDTIEKLAKDIVVLHDDYGAVSSIILRSVRTALLEKGYDIITCYCAMAPYEKIEHIFVPALGKAWCTSNATHTLQLPKQKNIHCLARFCNLDSLNLRKKRLQFNKKATRELFAQASLLQAEAKAAHDKLETYYVAALDTTGINEATQRLIQSL
ncbi:MAG: hypothetical protein PHG02_03100 [Oscillospiraceae bacterium]|nr:hypothetical protein [Oscillospiraceae bacterium]